MLIRNQISDNNLTKFYLEGLFMRTGRPREDAEIRFMRFVKVLENGCWEWTGKRNKDGYGQFSIPNGMKGKSVPAHRWIYEKRNGPLTAGQESDHQCHLIESCPGGRTCPHRRCVNPAHIVATSRWGNLIRSHSITAKNVLKTHCYKGHPLTADNVHTKYGWRVCKICAKAKWTRANQRKSTLRYQLKEAQEKIKELEAKLK
jgi:hypothetical protein